MKATAEDQDQVRAASCDERCTDFETGDRVGHKSRRGRVGDNATFLNSHDRWRLSVKICCGSTRIYRVQGIVKNQGDSDPDGKQDDLVETVVLNRIAMWTTHVEETDQIEYG